MEELQVDTLSEEGKGHDSREDLVTNAVIVACVVGIIVVAALIILTPREKEEFTQLWLKPWKLNLTNASAQDEGARWIVEKFNSTSPIHVGSVLGIRFYVSEPRGETEIWFFEDGVPIKNLIADKATVHFESNSLFLDAIDREEKQILFWEYPKTLRNPSAGPEELVRYAFVIENNQGADYTYEAEVIVSGDGNSTKVEKNIPVPKDQRKTCIISFYLTPGEVKRTKSGNNTKVITRLDTGEEVFFWLGNSDGA
jgi:hypothetical protein